MICRLAARLCPLDGLRDPSLRLPLLVPSLRLSLAPIDMIETERLCVLPSFEAPPAPPSHDPDPGCDRPTLTGALKDNVVRWPLFGGGGLELSVLTCFVFVLAPFLCLSLSPLADCGCSEIPGVAGLIAIFLKVI